MNESTLQHLLSSVADGSLPPQAAAERLRTLPFTSHGEVLADTHRSIRQGFPEVVFAEGKTSEQTASALAQLVAAHDHALATRVDAATAAALGSRFPHGAYDPASRLFRIGSMAARKDLRSIAVVCAGTSDLPVAEEAAQTLEFAGCPVSRFFDVGVAGLHRLLARLEEIRQCLAIIAVAGMEGALPGVVAGLVSQPVIAVPTSVGYGASLGGFASLLTMLNSCSSGLSVVNIDNGFGAAVAVLRLLQPNAPASSGAAGAPHTSLTIHPGDPG